MWVDNFYNKNHIEYESNGDRNKTLSMEEYLNKIRPYLKEIINNLKRSDTWKIRLSIATNFMSSKDTDEEGLMHSKSDSQKSWLMITQMKLLKNFFNHFFLDIKLT